MAYTPKASTDSLDFALTAYTPKVSTDSLDFEIGSGAAPVTGTANITIGAILAAGVGTITDVPVIGQANISLEDILAAAIGEVSGTPTPPVVTSGAGSPLWEQLFKRQRAIIDEEEEILAMAMML